MGKDYAHRGNNQRQTTTRALPGWVWLIAGIAIGFVGAAGWYVMRPRADAAASVDAANDKAAPAGKKKITIPPKQPSRFAFYDLLPSYEVVVPKESLKPAPKAATPAGTTASAGPAATETPAAGKYLIQVGSFKDRKEAEQQRASLALLGVESRVETVTFDNKDTWYRVRIGPEKDQRRVETILSRLEENNVQAVVMMVPE